MTNLNTNLQKLNTKIVTIMNKKL